MIRGTGSFGERAEGLDAPGLFHALRPFLVEHPEWFVVYHSSEEYGLTVIGRQPQDRPPHVVHAWPPGYGPGTEFKRMAADELGIAMPNSCSCNALALEMDRLGVAGCREKFNHLVAEIKQNAGRWGWSDKFANYARASFGSLKSGLLFKINWLDPIPGLVTEAIRRAETVDQARRAA